MTMQLNSVMNDMSALPSFEAITEGARRATGVMASGASHPEPEVVETARRRQYSASEKRRLLAEAAVCKARGELGAFLRRERIYSSMLFSWRRQLGAADRVALAPHKRGPKPDAAVRQIAVLNRDNARLRKKLVRAELIIDAQKKLCVALGLPTADELSEDA
jgi:transposase